MINQRKVQCEAVKHGSRERLAFDTAIEAGEAAYEESLIHTKTSYYVRWCDSCQCWHLTTSNNDELRNGEIRADRNIVIFRANATLGKEEISNLAEMAEDRKVYREISNKLENHPLVKGWLLEFNLERLCLTARQEEFDKESRELIDQYMFRYLTKYLLKGINDLESLTKRVEAITKDGEEAARAIRALGSYMYHSVLMRSIFPDLWEQINNLIKEKKELTWKTKAESLVKEKNGSL